MEVDVMDNVKIVRTTYSYFHISFLTITEQLGGSSADHFSLVFHVLDTENNKFTAQTGGNRLGFGLTYKVLVLLNTHNPKLMCMWVYVFLDFQIRIIIIF